MEVSLTELRNGESGCITTVKRGGRGMGRGGSHGKWGFERRLADMGLTPGTKITVVKSAPLHGPLEVLVRATRLALGRGVAERIYVEVAR